MALIKKFLTSESFLINRKNHWNGYVCPFTHTVFNKEYTSFFDLEQQVIEFRQINNLPEVNCPFKSVRDELQNFFCQKAEFKRECCPSPEYQVVQSCVDFVKNAAKAVQTFVQQKTQTLYSNDQLVTQAQAEARASICLKCPLHDPSKKPRDGLSKTWAWVHKNKTTPYDNKLGTCTGCGCFVKIKAHYAIEPVYNNLSEEDKARIGGVKKQITEPYKNFECWQITEYKDKYGQ